MKTYTLLLPLLLFFSNCKEELAPRPVRVFHGLGVDCGDEDRFDENYRCVETGAGNKSFYKSIKDQGMEGCRILKKEIDSLKPSFYVIGFSQGGLIARWIQLHCEDVGPLIKRMVLVGTPNLGMSVFPKSEAFQQKVYTKKEIDEIVKKNKDMLDSLPEGERNSKISELYQLTESMDEIEHSSLFNAGVKVAGWMAPVLKVFNFAPLNYLNRSSRYATLITDLATETQIGNLNNLDFLVIIANRDERVVSPPESVTFGIKILDEKGNTIAKPQTSEFIKTHPMIKKLWKEKKLITCLSNSSHSALEDNELGWIQNTLFSESMKALDYKSSAEEMKNTYLNNNNKYCSFNNPQNESPQSEFNETTNGKVGESNIDFILSYNLI